MTVYDDMKQIMVEERTVITIFPDKLNNNEKSEFIFFLKGG